MNILESIGKAIGIESLQKVVPSLKKAYEIATQNKDKGFFDKIRLFYDTYAEEMSKLDKDKKGIAADTQDKVQNILQGAVTLGKGNVVDQMKMRLNGRQKEMAYLIENLFTKRLKAFDRNLSDGAIRGIVAAALINANQESQFNPNATGDSGRGIGLFQVHPWGGGVAYRKVPENNINLILDKEVCTGRGKTLIARAKAGADVAELTALFSKYIERPGDEKGEMEKRANIARNVFRGGVTPEPRAVAAAPSEGSGKMLSLNIPNGVCKLKNNQDAWFFGSSSVVNSAQNLAGNFGYLGVTGINPRNFLKNLKSDWLEQIEKFDIRPRSIVLTGMGQNAIHRASNVASALSEYKQISNLLKQKFPGVSVKVVTVNPGTPDDKNVGVARAEFNRKLRQEYGSDCIDVASGLTEENGTVTKREYAGGDRIHLNSSGKKIWNRIVTDALSGRQSA
ncbi:hypothetical protein COY05_02885 [Candidatus Peregrinibacteria bacterium CG_4_10_14_0_2_um_filter_38_24]|nr:MAG: hypothetical protein COY05_02885 [Candidatus Peregrinibacteria bacterium CG_4_10_14_0_2_um_filter_38_24]PJC38786.1 MAG: hypothetical protein CO044_03115 [Candidatus Peregrinibacteria bacterium CG_4_9_14_0_2_um_filter_38_9]